jgi:hypothetical protein
MLEGRVRFSGIPMEVSGRMASSSNELPMASNESPGLGGARMRGAMAGVVIVVAAAAEAGGEAADATAAAVVVVAA